ncbi:hypothetical protein CPB86DRAFT_791428 [Serendipita vermifera]|nr:hypothetical protein CPB86DRAFT_791428 [Serendipita vermifera]
MNSELVEISFPSITKIEDISLGPSNPLEPIRAGFFIPRLSNKPQDPIIDALDLEHAVNEQRRRGRYAPSVDNIQLQSKVNGHIPPRENGDDFAKSYFGKEINLDDIWVAAGAGSQAKGSNVKSWDALGSVFAANKAQSALLSEQEPSVFAPVQEFVMPNVHGPISETINASPAGLLGILETNLVGYSSQIYEWDFSTETFCLSTSYKHKVLILYGLSEDLSRDIIQLYLTIGTCMRRLDAFIDSQRCRDLHPTMHAFLHSLEVILAHQRRHLARLNLECGTNLSRLWLQYGESKEILISLTKLCRLGLESKPPYKPLPKESFSLLSRIYTHVNFLFQSAASRTLRATLSYILSTSSRPYFRHVEHTIGIGRSRLSHQPHDADIVEVDEFGVNMDPEAASRVFHIEFEEYPVFFSDELKAQVVSATRGLKVLAAANPNHPLLDDVEERQCEWVWHEDLVEGIYSGQRSRPFDHVDLTPTHFPAAKQPTESNTAYAPGLSGLHVFDLEPGSQWRDSKEHATSLPIDTKPFQEFLATFPSQLPSSTPTLSHLAAAVLYPLRVQSNRLSNALLDLFVHPPFSLTDHFLLLRSFVFLASQRFTLRLRNALFTESDAYQPVGRGTRARTRARLGIRDARDKAAEAEEFAEREDGTVSGAKWGVGLGLGLSERGTWPPGGAELGVALRRVIVDSLDEMDQLDEPRRTNPPWREKMKSDGTVLKEAEWRLGFAIRDLPVNEGREEWLDPSSIAALDFLYLDYKPPLPVTALITADILSKYQRVFNFLLRLLRVETVSRGLFNSIHKGSDIFPEKPQARALLRRFRFLSHVFVSSLITYVFDTAIGVQFDRFMEKFEDIIQRHVASIHERIANLDDNSPSKFMGVSDAEPVADIFEVMNDHSKILDKILGGCILRTQQRAISDVQEDILSIVLRLGSLVRDLRRGALHQDDAETQLQKLFYNFERRMITFVSDLFIRVIPLHVA